jgi:hypothetical protein
LEKEAGKGLIILLSKQKKNGCGSKQDTEAPTFGKFQDPHGL